MYDTLLNVDAKTGNPVPWLGKWTVSSDNLTYSWEIDAKANWSDGKPIIAEDYLARAKAVARSKLTTQKSSWTDVEGFNDYRDGKATSISGITIDSANPKKFAVKFGKSFCPALINVFGVAPIPAHVFGKYTVDDDPSKSDNLKLYEWKDNGYVYIGWRLNNPNVPALQDKRVRQALAYGLDMSQVVQSVVLGHGEKQIYHTPSVSWASPGTAGFNDYKYDGTKAEQLIKDAGYTKGSDG